MECSFFAHLETHLTIGFSRKNQLKCIGTAVIMLYILNNAKSQSIMNFKYFENHLDLVFQPGCQPAVRPGCTRCRVVKITQHNRLLCGIYKIVVPKIIFRVRHGDSFSLLSSLSNGMHNQCDHNIPYKV